VLALLNEGLFDVESEIGALPHVQGGGNRASDGNFEIAGRQGAVPKGTKPKGVPVSVRT
jgi:hypothetical protein